MRWEMDSLELNKSKYIISNIKDILYKKLILNKPLTKGYLLVRYTKPTSLARSRKAFGDKKTLNLLCK